MKHRVAIDVSILDRTETGSSVYVRELIKQIEEIAPQDIELIVFRGPKPIRRRNIFTSIFNGLIQLFWLNIQFPLFVFKNKIEVAHFPSNMIPLFLPCKVVVSILDANFMRQPHTYKYLWRTYAKKQFTYAARHADKVITISENSKSDIVRFFSADPGKVEVIYLACRSLPADVSNNASYGRYILFVGGAYPSKNIPRLIRAYKEFISKQGIDNGYNLVIAGGGGADYLNIRKLVVELELSERVFFAGHISDGDLYILYKYASLFAFPSLNEGFGFPPLEAMAYKVPVVASNASSLPEILGDAAIYFDPLSVEDIAGKMELVLGDVELQTRLKSLSALQVGKYSWKICGEHHLHAYREVIHTNTETNY